MRPEIISLLQSDEPSIRYKMLVNVLGSPPDSTEVEQARCAIPRCERVRSLLAEMNEFVTVDALSALKSAGRLPLH